MKGQEIVATKDWRSLNLYWAVDDQWRDLGRCYRKLANSHSKSDPTLRGLRRQLWRGLSDPVGAKDRRSLPSQALLPRHLSPSQSQQSAPEDQPSPAGPIKLTISKKETTLVLLPTVPPRTLVRKINDADQVPLFKSEVALLLCEIGVEVKDGSTDFEG